MPSFNSDKVRLKACSIQRLRLLHTRFNSDKVRLKEAICNQSVTDGYVSIPIRCD